MKTLWIEQSIQTDMEGGQTLILTANIRPTGQDEETELRREAKKQMNELAKGFKGRVKKKTQVSPDWAAKVPEYKTPTRKVTKQDRLRQKELMQVQPQTPSTNRRYVGDKGW